jgi:ribonucleoside-triphosphate reductase (formate)
MNEALLNFTGGSIAQPEGQAFAQDILNFKRARLAEFQDQTGHVYNLEATPAEGTGHRLARIDKQRYPEIITAGDDAPYYTNSTQLPVGQTEDIFEALDLQDDLQSLYTGGTVLHLYLGQAVEDPNLCKALIKRIFSRYKLPYLSITPTFSICHAHGYFSGEHFKCPTCGEVTEVWSRVTGYLRPVQHFNDGKRAEYFERRKFALPEVVA